LTVVRISGIYKDAAEEPAKAARVAPPPKAEASAEEKKPAAKAKASPRAKATAPKSGMPKTSAKRATTRKKAD
jgi:hypothetical protein